MPPGSALCGSSSDVTGKPKNILRFPLFYPLVLAESLALASQYLFAFLIINVVLTACSLLGASLHPHAVVYQGILWPIVPCPGSSPHAHTVAKCLSTGPVDESLDINPVSLPSLLPSPA